MFVKNILKKDKKALIILNGYPLTKQYLDFFWSKNDICICVNGSYQWTSLYGLIPDFVMGDLDSFFKISTHHKTKILEFPDQNFTDTEKVFQYLLEKKINYISVIGILGSRLDHVFWNLNLIKHYQKKFKNLDFFTATEKIILSTKKKESFNLPIGSRISFFPFYKNVKNVTTRGLKYELQNKELSLENFVSISNKVIEKQVSLEWSAGELIIFLEQKSLTKLTKENK